MIRKRKLSATMAAALAEVIDHGGELVVWSGGFWTHPNCAVLRVDGDGYRVPAWYAGTNTVRALASRGHLECTERAGGRADGYPIRFRVDAALLAAKASP